MRDAHDGSRDAAQGRHARARSPDASGGPMSSGPSVVAVRADGVLRHHRALAPTMRDLCETADAGGDRARRSTASASAARRRSSPTRRRRRATHRSPGCWRRSTCRRSRRPASPSPRSMLERVIEEQARGAPEKAAAIRAQVESQLGGDLRAPEARLAAGAGAQAGADRAGRLVAVPRGRHRPGRRDLHQGAADVGRRPRHGGGSASALDLEQSRARGGAGGHLDGRGSSAPRSATTSTCAMSRAARRCCCRRPRTTTRRPPSVRSSASSTTTSRSTPCAACEVPLDRRRRGRLPARPASRRCRRSRAIRPTSSAS